VEKRARMTFPTVSGSNLQRQKIALPQELEGEYNLLFVPFQQWQQSEVNSWIALAEQLEEQYPNLVYYELPTIRTLNSLSKFFINEGMRAGIPNTKSRQRTITLYLDKSSFQSALAMPDEDHIYILIIDRQGNEFFRARGSYTKEAEADLRDALLQLFGTDKQ
jgi:hypothetical protein